MSNFLPFRCVAIIGLGLIGGSLAKTIRRYRLAKSVVAYDQDTAALDMALQSKIIDQRAASAAMATVQADFIVLATPVQTMTVVLQEIATTIRPDALLIDVGSVKTQVITAASQILLPDVFKRFIPCHPIAGAEKSGVMAARDDLFAQHKMILTPLAGTDQAALYRITQFWEAMGMQVLRLTAEQHDKILAMTSHLPHLLAFSLVHSLVETEESLDVFRYAAGGFADFTRIAASDPRMWHDIFLANKSEVLRALAWFREDLNDFAQAIEHEDSASMLSAMAEARSARQYFAHRLTQTGFTMQQNSAKPQMIHYAIDLASTIKISGTIQVPGDKSISHRAIMLGAVSTGRTEITGFLEGEDNLATLQAFRLLGVVIEGPNQGKVVVHGVGLHGLKPARDALYLGNSGTSMRLLCGLLAGQLFDSILTGDASLSKRPMARVMVPLRQMGAKIRARGDQFAPVHIQGRQSLKGTSYTLPIASAQVKSCILLAGLYAQGETRVIETGISRDHTERMLQGFGYKGLQQEGQQICIHSGYTLQGQPIQVPGDISSAAFFLVLASLLPGSDLLLEGVGVNPTRTGIMDILQQMGADITLLHARSVTGEPVADIQVKAACLQAVTIHHDLVPRAIDEFPVIFVAAAFAEGVTHIQGIKELRYKESDRIRVMGQALTQLGIRIEEQEDAVTIYGIGCGTDLHSTNHSKSLMLPTKAIPSSGALYIETQGDHRIAMASVIAVFVLNHVIRIESPAKKSAMKIIIRDCANVATSFPGFVDLLKQLGLTMQVITE